MAKLALQADLWYNYLINIVDRRSAGNTRRSEQNLYERLSYGYYSIRSIPALQALPSCFPLQTRRKAIMLPRKGTPEYEAWKNSPAYEEWKQKMSEARKGRIPANKGKKLSPETKAKMAARQAAWHAENRGTEKYEEWRKHVGEGGKGKHANFTMKGKHHSPETIEKIRSSNKGKMKFSPEARARMSVERRGRKQSEEAKAKLSARNKGVKRSEEAKVNMSRAQKGRIITPEARAKTSETLKGRVIPPEARINMGKAQKGKKRSLETKAKLAALKTGSTHTPETKAKLSAINKAKYAALSPEEQIAYTEKRFRSGKNKNTSLEVYAAKLLDKWGVLYKQQQRIGRYYVDFLLSDQMLVLEVAGCFWHGCSQCGWNDEAHADKIEHDIKRTAFLVNKGYTVITLWQHELEPFMKAEKLAEP